MKRLLLSGIAAALGVATIPSHGNAVERYDVKLTKDQQIVHALNRLTFGPRPGDVDEVRKIGLEKWIALQLHPDQIPENPTLESRLKPLETLNMDTAAVIKEYVPQQQNVALAIRNTPLQELVTPDQMRKIQTGTAEERKSALLALPMEKRKQVYLSIPLQSVDAFPDLLKEYQDARQEQQQEQQKKIRAINPPLQDLLTQDQVQVAQRGNPDQVTALFEFLDPQKRKQVAAAMPAQALVAFPEIRREGQKLRQPQQIVSEDLKAGKMFRAIYSNRQLEEVLVDFWFNHFNVHEAKQVQIQGNAYKDMITSYERDAIRPNVLGHFKDLLLATARHPAMLVYLDNWESMTPDGVDAFSVGPFASQLGLAPALARIAHGLNENYGREIMELHTLGVNGGYTQDDVINVARAFTGWTVVQPQVNPKFIFAGFMHDTKEKVVLGHTIPAGGGENDGLQVIDILAHHPSTAKFISRELAQRFVADDPPQALVDRMAATFTKTDGDLRAVLETMFSSPEFFSEGAWMAKVKSPFESVVSAIRATGADAKDAQVLVQKVGDLGEPLYNKVEPTGYPNTGEAWVNSVMGRVNFATALVSGVVPGVRSDAANWEGKSPSELAQLLLGHPASSETQAALNSSGPDSHPTPRALAGLVLSSPDFGRR